MFNQLVMVGVNIYMLACYITWLGLNLIVNFSSMQLGLNFFCQKEEDVVSSATTC